jgi:hypothetical protein
MSEADRIRALFGEGTGPVPARRRRLRGLLSPRTAAALWGSAWGLLLLIPVVLLVVAFTLAFHLLDRYVNLVVGGR